MRERVCGALCGLSFLGMIGFAGGLDYGGPLLPGIAGMAVCLAGFILFGTLAGIIER